MTILLVDDQRSVLDGLLAGIDFPNIGFETVYTASSAQNALTILEENDIDVLMTDIEMPGQNGLELLNIVRETYPNMLRILLTSHAVFSYAQEGVKLGCFDYIVQPAPYEVITESLTRAVVQLRQNREKKELNRYGTLFVSKRSAFLDNIAFQLCSADDREISEAISVLNEAGISVSRSTPALLYVADLFSFTDQAEDSLTKKEFRGMLVNTLRDSLQNYDEAFLVTITQQRYGVMILFSQNDSANRPDEEKLSQSIFRALEEKTGNAPAAIYASPEFTIGTLHAGLSLIRNAMRENIARTSGVFYAHTGTTPGETPESLSGCLNRWNSMLRANNRNFLLRDIYDYIDNTIAVMPNKYQHLCELHQMLTQMLFRYFYDNNIDIYSLFSEEYSYSDYLESYRTIESFKKSMSYILSTIGRESKPEQNIDYVEKTKLYIIENANSNLHVKDVADYINLNPEYLTRLFKKATGINIKDYIMECKISAAKDLLANSSLTVSMVALELGCSNFSHFAQMFKKLEGITPTEYRQKVWGKEEK